MPSQLETTRRLPARRRREAQDADAQPQSTPVAHDPSKVIELRHVTKHYADGTIALEDVSFGIGRGEFVFLVGSTGSGKSTIMRLLTKQLEPTSGSIVVAGRDLSQLGRKQVPFYRRNLGVVFQDFKLLPNRTVYDNVAYALSSTGATRKDIRAKVPDILRLTGLATKLHQYPDQLSGGEQQRVSIARAFVNHPPLLLADEPTGNLDPKTSIGIMQLLYRINRTGTTVLVSTHDHHMVDQMKRRVIEVSTGRIVRDEAGGGYTSGETQQTTDEFAAMMRDVEVGRVRDRLDHLGTDPSEADAIIRAELGDGEEQS